MSELFSNYGGYARRTFLLAALLSCASCSATAQEARPEVRAIPNFGVVTESILRGGQPRPEGYRVLRTMGVDLVVSFRGEGDGVAKERQRVTAEGMRFVNIPWSGWGHPRLEQVKQFFDLLDSNSGKKLFLHCRRGAERTGVMVALYRMTRQGWSAEQAYREMEEHGFRGFWFHHLKEYVFDFAGQMHSAPIKQPPLATQAH